MLVTAFSPMYSFLGPGEFWLMLPFAAVSAFGTGSFVALPNSMKADVIDIDTARTGENRAGTFFSAWLLATRFAGSLGGSFGLWARPGRSAGRTSSRALGRVGALVGGLTRDARAPAVCGSP